MGVEDIDWASVDVSFLLENDDDNKLGSTELDNAVRAVNVFIEMRNDIFNKREEKIQQFKQDELQKLKNEEESMLNEYKGLEKKLSECRMEQEKVNVQLLDAQEKMLKDRALVSELTDKLIMIKKEKAEKQEKYNKTFTLYSTVLKWYEDYLNICVKLSKDNPQVFTFYFGNSWRQNYMNVPYITFETSDDMESFKILETDLEFESEKENFKKCYNSRDVKFLIHELHEAMKTTNSLSDGTNGKVS